ncbi:unnamed protein product, partial [Prorocentrum cordatum]
RALGPRCCGRHEQRRGSRNGARLPAGAQQASGGPGPGGPSREGQARPRCEPQRGGAAAAAAAWCASDKRREPFVRRGLLRAPPGWRPAPGAGAHVARALPGSRAPRRLGRAAARGVAAGWAAASVPQRRRPCGGAPTRSWLDGPSPALGVGVGQLEPARPLAFPLGAGLRSLSPPCGHQVRAHSPSGAVMSPVAPGARALASSSPAGSFRAVLPVAGARPAWAVPAGCSSACEPQAAPPRRGPVAP